jgi:hypothetical protein
MRCITRTTGRNNALRMIANAIGASNSCPAYNAAADAMTANTMIALVRKSCRESGIAFDCAWRCGIEQCAKSGCAARAGVVLALLAASALKEDPPAEPGAEGGGFRATAGAAQPRDHSGSHECRQHLIQSKACKATGSKARQRKLPPSLAYVTPPRGI